MLEQFLKNAEYHYEEKFGMRKLLAFIPDKKIILIDIYGADPPNTMDKEEIKKIFSIVFNQIKWNLEDSLQGVQAEYFYGWEKEKENGKIRGSLFDYPGFNGVAACQPMNPSTLVTLNALIMKDLKKEGKL